MKFVTAFFAVLLLFSCKHARDRLMNATSDNRNDSEAVSREPPNPYIQKDISPMDISYLPPDYPVQKMGKTAAALPVARLIYSRPHRQGRKIFGSLLKYGEPWRLGANEATELEFFQPVIIEGKRLPKGRYVLYCIPQPKTWTLILNSNIYSWGLKTDVAKDQYRFTVPVQQVSQSVEYFTMVFEQPASGAVLLIAWDDVVARLPIKF